MMRPTFDVSGYLKWILPPMLMMLLLLVRRARAQMQAADPESLDRLRRAGVLHGDAGEQYRELMRLLADIAPVVWLRERPGMRLYGGSVRWLARCLPSMPGVQREMGRVAAYQAHRYAHALAQVQQLRDDRFWGRQPASEPWVPVSKLPQ
jgi:hypothetical protein